MPQLEVVVEEAAAAAAVTEETAAAASGAEPQSATKEEKAELVEEASVQATVAKADATMAESKESSDGALVETKGKSLVADPVEEEAEPSPRLPVSPKLIAVAAFGLAWFVLLTLPQV